MVSNAKKQRLDFDDPNSLTDKNVLSPAGISKDQFECLALKGS